MRAVVQRVDYSSVKVDGGEIVGEINRGGLLVLLGIGEEDSPDDLEYMVDKILGLRIFEDDLGKMNLSLKDIDGEILVVSQFTLYGDVRRGKRPSFTNSAKPELGEKYYEEFIAKCREEGIKTETGVFGAHMNVEIANNGPVTILIDSKKNILGGILLKIITVPAGIYAANCYIVYSENTKKGIVIDPGGDVDDIMKKIEELDLDIEYIVLTHGHGDHIGGVLELKSFIDVPVAIHKEDEYMLNNGDSNLSSLMAMGTTELNADILLEEGDEISFGDLNAKVIHTPGHTPGGISIKIEDNIFTGDTLFAGSIGRTDFPGGSYEEIISSIKK